MSNRRSPWLRLFSYFVYAFLYFPIVVLIVFAFNSSRTNVTFEGVVNIPDQCGPFYWFCVLFKDQHVLEAAGNTLKIALTSTVVSTIIGTMAALALQRYTFKAKAFSEVSLYIPIIIPEIVMGISILVLFSAVFTWLNGALGLVGDARLSMGLGTVILSHIAFSIPFVVLVVRARLVAFDRSVEEAAMDLGANEWQTFRRVTLPLIMPGVLSGAMLAFTLSLDDFIITFFTNGPGSTTLPIYVYGLLRRIITPEVNALSTVWIVVVFLVLLLSQRLQRRSV
jgi:spermidine/putrescine transport system permease protein